MQKTIMNNRTRGNLTRCDGQKGAVLVVGLLLTTVLTLVAVNASKHTVIQQRMANNYRFSIEAMNNAETGFRSALNQINDQNLILNGFDDELDPDGDGAFDDRFSLTLADQANNVFYNVVMVDDDDGDGNLSVDANGIVLLMSQGISSVGSTRTTEVRIADTPGGAGALIPVDQAIMTQGSFTMSGNVEHYGTNQDIHSNADIDILGTPTTAGSVSASGSVTGTPAGGGTTESGVANIDIPQIKPSMFEEYADYIFESDGDIYDAVGCQCIVANAAGPNWQGWRFTGDKWTTVGNNIQGGMLYFKGVYGNVTVVGAPGTAINPWMISILADGYIKIAGTPRFANYVDPTDPPEVQAILFMSGADIKINGNANQTYTGIIAANEQIDVSGNASIEGVLIAADKSNDSDLVVDNRASGDMHITYDGGYSLRWDDGAGDGIAVVLSWRDREIARNTGVFYP